jgi:hypothetical protein
MVWRKMIKEIFELVANIVVVGRGWYQPSIWNETHRIYNGRVVSWDASPC